MTCDIHDKQHVDGIGRQIKLQNLIGFRIQYCAFWQQFLLLVVQQITRVVKATKIFDDRHWKKDYQLVNTMEKFQETNI